MRRTESYGDELSVDLEGEQDKSLPSTTGYSEALDRCAAIIEAALRNLRRLRPGTTLTGGKIKPSR